MEVLNTILISICCAIGGAIVGVSDEDNAKNFIGILSIIALVILGALLGFWWKGIE